MRVEIQLFLVFFAIFSISSCATKVVNFKSEKKANVDLVSLDALDAAGEKLGETPVEVPIEKLQGKVVRVSAEGKTPQYWVFQETLGVRTEAQMKLLDEAKINAASGGEKDRKGATNRAMRLLLSAYQALSTRDWETAQGLADKAGEIEPELSSPLIVQGIALMQQGKKADAKLVLAKAKALDPDDGNIDRLLEVLE